MLNHLIALILLSLALLVYSSIKKQGTFTTLITRKDLFQPQNEKVIWSFWHDDKLPLLTRVCMKSWKIHNPDYIINMLSEATLSKFIDVRQLPVIYPKLSYQHKSDIIRLSLLKKYGGYWIDASILLNKPLRTQWEPMKYDVGGYEADHFKSDKGISMLENWFLAAPKDSPLIKDWYDEFVGGFHKFGDTDPKENRKNYIQDLQRRGVNLQRLRYLLPSFRGYLAMHCAYLCITEKRKYKVRSFSAGIFDPDHSSKTPQGPLSYNTDAFFYVPFTACVPCVESMLQTRKYSTMPMIKFTQVERKLFDDSIWDSLTRESTFGDIIFS